jgi:hypothetical protein
MSEVNEIGTNLGQAIKLANVENKIGTKLQNLQDKVTEAKVILKTMKTTDTPEDSKEKLVKIIGIFYKTHNYDRQISYLRNKRKTPDFLSQAFGIVASRLDQLERFEETLNN